MRLLDLFSCAGGAAVGYHRAGFEIVGIDNKPQPNYPFAFIQMDALEAMDRLTAGEGLPASDGRTYYLSDFAVIHASPPCQKFTSLNKMHNAKRHPDLLTPTRARLRAWGGVYVIENVPRSPIHGLFLLCGTQFGLGASGAQLRRHRYFEMEPPIAALIPPCAHRRNGRVIGVYGGHGRDRRRKANTEDFSVEQRREAMGIDWMTGAELSQAIPPAYTEYIGCRLMVYLDHEKRQESPKQLSLLNLQPDTNAVQGIGL